VGRLLLSEFAALESGCEVQDVRLGPGLGRLERHVMRTGSVTLTGLEPLPSELDWHTAGTVAMKTLYELEMYTGTYK
jgi:hypothetical protein